MILNNKKRIIKYKGQSLLEVVLSIGIASMVISALIILGAASVKTINSSLRRNEASKLANEGIEAMRFYRDQLGNGFSVLIDDPRPDACYRINAAWVEQIDYTAGPPPEATFCDYSTDTIDPEGPWDEITLVDVNFQRRIYAEYTDPAGARDEILITSTVRWPESSNDGFQEVVMTTVLTDWGN